METLTLTGVDAKLSVFNDRIEIAPKGLLGKIGGQGNETILIRDITSVEVRECSFINGGHIQFAAAGTNEKKNRVEFGGFGDRKAMNETANQIKAFVLKQMQVATTSPAAPVASTSDELIKLSQLKEQGILSEDEFQAAKKKLLGL
jgi:hypothetical protein